MLQDFTTFENDVQRLHDSFRACCVDNTFEMLLSFKFFVEDWKADVPEKGQRVSFVVQKYFLSHDMRQLRLAVGYNFYNLTIFQGLHAF